MKEETKVTLRDVIFVGFLRTLPYAVVVTTVCVVLWKMGMVE